MKLKLFLIDNVLSAWIISITYFSAINAIIAQNEAFECGTQNLEDFSATFVSQYEYPWKAAFFMVIENKDDIFLGSGTLINENTILTLANIIIGTDNLSEFKVILGLRKLNDHNEEGRKVYAVKHIVSHPNWRPKQNSLEGNIAIITLTEDVTFSRYIRPICIPDESIASITTGQTSSWGSYDRSMKRSEKPRKKLINIMNDQECLRREPYLANLLGKQSFCAGAKDQAICAGANGDGFYVEKNGKFYLRGIVFSGVKGCSIPKFAPLADVLKYRDFLEENNIQSFTRSYASGEDCGVPSAVVGLVSHGDEFPHGLFPWLAALIRYRNDKQRFMCGGTLVSAKTVVTAAHCIHKKGASTRLKNHELRVALGANDLSDPNELQRKTMRVEKIDIHSTWKPAEVSKFTGDIALLALERNVVFDDFIRPICLSKSFPSIQSGVVAGWGRRENQNIGTTNETPRKIDIPIVSAKTCYEKVPRLAGAGWDESFCAGREGVSVCDGDSGSGLYVKVDGKYYLKGIVSSAILHEECVNGYYSIFTDAFEYFHFITEK